VTRSFFWSAVRVVAGVSLLTYVLSKSDWRVLSALITAPWLILCVVILPVIGGSVESIRMGILYDALDMRLPFWTGFHIVTMATFFNFCIPGATGGDVVKMWYLNAIARRHPAEIAAIWMVDRLTGVLSLLLLVIIVGGFNFTFITHHASLVWGFAGAVGVTLASLVAGALACLDLARVFDRMLASYPRIRRTVSRVEDSIAAFRRRPGALVKGVGVSMLGHVALLSTFIALGRYFMPQLEPRLVGLLALSGLFANALPISPGGLGVGEAAFDSLFRLVGVDSGAALLIAWRLGMLPMCLAGCILYIAGMKQRRAAIDADAVDPVAAVR
jgi:uncharacterized protein (TIRG00374 family)